MSRQRPSSPAALRRCCCAGAAVALPLAALAAFIIGITRLALGVHSPAEVVIGAGVGLAGALALPMLAGPRTAAVRCAARSR